MLISKSNMALHVHKKLVTTKMHWMGLYYASLLSFVFVWCTYLT